MEVLDVEGFLTLGALDVGGFGLGKFWTLMVFNVVDFGCWGFCTLKVLDVEGFLTLVVLDVLEVLDVGNFWTLRAF